MVWIIFALLTGACVLCAVWPLARPRTGQSRRLSDTARYQAELAELEWDQGRGGISPEAAASARAEAGRRLLAVVAAAQANPPLARDPTRTLLAAALIIIVIPLASLALYIEIGSPLMPDRPLEARLNAPLESQDIATAVARIEAHLATHPDDGRGYEILAPVYMRMKRYDDAVRAYLSAINLLGETAQRRLLYGEALVYAAGLITPDARASFEAALKLDSKAFMAQYYLALAAEQDGDLAQAHAILSRMVADAPADAPWLAETRRHLEAVDQQLTSAVNASREGEKNGPSRWVQAPPGSPTSEAGEAAAIAALPPNAQRAAIQNMVDGLAARLNADGRDTEGWMRLIRAYVVLQKPELARQAWARARKQIGDDPAAGGKLDALAHELGLGG